MGGAAPPPNPPFHFFWQLLTSKSLQDLARSNALPSYSMFCRWGGLRPPPPPPQHTRSYLWHRTRKQDLAALSRKRHSDTFSDSKLIREFKSVATLTPEIPVTVDTFESPRTCESPKTSTVTRMATLPSAIPVTVDIFEFGTSSESRKTSKVTRMATVTPAIPVTVDTFRI